MATDIITEWTCNHPEQCEDIHRHASVVYYATYNDDPEHWDFALRILAKKLMLEQLETPAFASFPQGLKFIRLCEVCHEAYLKHKGIGPAPKVAELAVDDSELAEALERIEVGEALYFCNGCNEFMEEDDLVELRECPHCDEVFNGNEGRNCPSCNRPFTRNLGVMGCPDCLDSHEVLEEVTVEWLKSQMSEVSNGH